MSDNLERVSGELFQSTHRVYEVGEGVEPSITVDDLTVAAGRPEPNQFEISMVIKVTSPVITAGSLDSTSTEVFLDSPEITPGHDLVMEDRRGSDRLGGITTITDNLVSDFLGSSDPVFASGDFCSTETMFLAGIDNPLVGLPKVVHSDLEIFDPKSSCLANNRLDTVVIHDICTDVCADISMPNGPLHQGAVQDSQDLQNRATIVPSFRLDFSKQTDLVESSSSLVGMKTGSLGIGDSTKITPHLPSNNPNSSLVETGKRIAVMPP